VVHLAARAGVRASIADPTRYVRVNELGGLNVLEQSKLRGNLPIVYASTSSVYGRKAKPPFSEDDPAIEPLSPYAASKRAAELMAGVHHRLYGVPIAILRFFTVYGPRGRPDMAVASFTRALGSGRPIRLHGEQTARDFTYVDDIVDGVIGAIDWVQRERAFDVFNLGRSQPVRVRRLIELLGAALGVEPSVVLGELEPGESPLTAADVSKARRAFGYEPKVALEEGIARYMRWLRTAEAPASEVESAAVGIAR
jgi:UDP-glucuronate 4-epimerase